MGPPDLSPENAARFVLFSKSMQRGAVGAAPMAGDYAFDDAAPFEAPNAPRLHFIEHSYAGDPTNWWIPNQAAVEAMLRSSGFQIEAHPEAEVYICRTGERPYGAELPRLR